MNIKNIIFQTLRLLRRQYLRVFWKLTKSNSKLFFPQKNFYYSQSGQDGIVYNHFFKGEKGIFVDIGANHPTKLSNTFYFEEHGWSGFAFDPIKDMNAEWKTKRPNTEISNIAIGSEAKMVSFHKSPNVDDWGNMLSSVVDDDNENTVQVQCLPLSEAITTTKVDLLSIDVEGYEMDVLRGIDFSAMRPKIIILENNTQGNVQWGSQEPRDYLKARNYKLWGRVFGMDDIYLDAAQ
jgi:FkbM family methyltransferase